MTSAEKIASLKARREDAYQEALRVGGLSDEEFGLAESIAYAALLERIDATNEYIKFLTEESHAKPRKRNTHTCDLALVS